MSVRIAYATVGGLGSGAVSVCWSGMGCVLAWAGGSTASSSRSEQAMADGSPGSTCERCAVFKCSMGS